MTFLQILKIVFAILTIVTGFISLIWPRALKGFTGLQPDNPRGVTEIRAVMGGLFIGLGAAPFLLRTPSVYQAIGIMYLAIGIVRAASMLLDKSMERSNWISLAVEIVFGVGLVA